MNSNNSGLYIGIGIVVLIVVGALVYIYYPSASVTSDTSDSAAKTATTDTAKDSTSNGDTGATANGSVALPSVMTGNFAANISSTTAVIGGAVIPNGGATVYWFEYGTTTTFTLRTIRQSIGAGTSAAPVGATLGSLKAGTQYSFRLGAQNSAGTTYGGIYNFVTAAK